MACNEKIRFIDLGLPSGTLWASSNIPHRMSWEDAVSEYGDFLPTAEQFKELRELCTMKVHKGLFRKNGWTRFTGPNGRSVCFPNVGRVIGAGHYWLKHPNGPAKYELTLSTVFLTYNLEPKDRPRSNLLVRLVSNK